MVYICTGMGMQFVNVGVPGLVKLFNCTNQGITFSIE